MRLALLLWTYWRTQQLAFASRESLEAHQRIGVARHLKWLARHSPYFAPYAGLPLSQWPGMDKAVMMERFDEMNTGQLTLAEVLEVSLRSEQERDFAPLLRGHTVGLSSGTSSRRGVFVANAAERATWAGIMLAKALPRGLFAGERVALFLRANSSLYTAVQSRWLTFRFFDLFRAFEDHLPELARYQPTIVVAPAQVLRQLALARLSGSSDIRPVKVISVAEVLEPTDRELIVQAFGLVHQLYQATEGFLAATCSHGVLHLNEEFVHVEPKWLDAERLRFTPIITDFTRRTQPIVRYELNDILVRRPRPCACGNPAMALEGIEGRCDDLLTLPGSQGGTVPVFADVVNRALAQVLPVTAEYALVQTGPARLALIATADERQLLLVQEHLQSTFDALGVASASLSWQRTSAAPAFNPTAKRRRIRREFRT